MSTEVNVRLEGGILFIGINRPDKRNCVNRKTARLLVDAIKRLNDDPLVKIGILYGEGKHFCAGYDLSEVSDSKQARMEASTSQNFRYMGPSVMNLEKPLIAAIKGYAVAGGLELALMADIRVCGRTAIFGVFCRRVGVPLIDGGTVRLPRVIGLGRALHMILTGEAVSSEQALQWGLVTKIVDDREALNCATELAKQIVSNPYNCILADRRSVMSSFNLITRDAMEFEFASFSVIPEAVIGAEQFLKRSRRNHSKL
uniref:Enoyl-CoA hydratase/isomerase family protein n=1 Tax=Haemonchus contortus TaxID=6289 RepID=A0A7I4YNY3_HAECO